MGPAQVEGISEGNLHIQSLPRSRQEAGARQPEKGSWKPELLLRGRGVAKQMPKGEESRTEADTLLDASLKRLAELAPKDDGGMEHETHTRCRWEWKPIQSLWRQFGNIYEKSSIILTTTIIKAYLPPENPPLLFVHSLEKKHDT